MATAALTFAGLVFTAGYNWSRIVELREWREAHEVEMQRTEAVYVRMDVAAAEYRLLRQEIVNLQRQLADLQVAVDRLQR